MSSLKFVFLCLVVTITANGQSIGFGNPDIGLPYNPYTSAAFGYGLGPQYATLKGTLAANYLYKGALGYPGGGHGGYPANYNRYGPYGRYANAPIGINPSFGYGGFGYIPAGLGIPFGGRSAHEYGHGARTGAEYGTHGHGHTGRSSSSASHSVTLGRIDRIDN